MADIGDDSVGSEGFVGGGDAIQAGEMENIVGCQSDLKVIDIEEEDGKEIQLQNGDIGEQISELGIGAGKIQSIEVEHRYPTRNFTYPQKASDLLQQLNNLRLAGKLVDVTLVSSDGREFQCHRAVLAASSSYFDAMFTDDLLESHSDHIELENIKGAMLGTILHAVYVCEIEVAYSTVQDLLATAHFLNYPHIVESCSQYLNELLRPQNCLGIAQLAETYHCLELQGQAWQYALKNFKEVSFGEEFLQLKPSIMEKLVCSDDLNVGVEDDVLEAVLRWTENDDTHKSELPLIFAKIRLPLVSDSCLQQVLSVHPYLHGNGKILTLVKDAQNLRELAKKGKRRDHELLKPRYAMRTEVMVVVGGMAENREWVQHVSCLNPKTGEWSSMADLPFDHSDYSVASVDSAIYVSGGFHRDKGTTTEVWCYEEMYDRWSRTKPLLQPRFNHSSVGYKHHIYVLGGEDSERTLTDVERYSPEQNKWEAIGTTNPAGSGMAVTALRGKLYIIGWLTNVRLMCVIQCFDLETLECTIIPCSGLNRQLFPAVALNDRIFILGGNRIKEVAVYDPETFTSSKAESMKFKRNTPSAAVVGGKIYVTGGELRQHVSRVECYDPELDLWDTVTPMPHAVCFHGSVTIKKYLGPPYYA